MDLRSIVSVLLPPESREPILGDLEERGFRFADAASVVMASYVSSFRREWFGPVPDLSSASDARIDLRVEQLLRDRRLALCWSLTGYSLRIAKFIAAPISLWWAAALLVALLCLLPIQATPSSLNSRQRYAWALENGVVIVPLVVLSWGKGWGALAPSSVQPYFDLTGTAVLIFLILYRSKRLRQERKNSRVPATPIFP